MRSGYGGGGEWPGFGAGYGYAYQAAGGWKGGPAIGAPPGRGPPAGGAGAKGAPAAQAAAAPAGRRPSGAAPSAAPSAASAAGPGAPGQGVFFGDAPWFSHPSVLQQSQAALRDAMASGQAAPPGGAGAQSPHGSMLLLSGAIEIGLQCGEGGPDAPGGAERIARLRAALFAEAARLLLAALGFSGEGSASPALRAAAVSRAAQSPAWKGLTPPMLLGQWFNNMAVPSAFGGAQLRAAFDGAGRHLRAQFACALGRAMGLEQRGANSSKPLRAPWAKVISQFPELAQLRALFLHVRRRMWEDARDTRERSRSPEAERKRQKGEKQQHPEAVRFYVKNAGDLSEDMLRMHFALFGNVSEMNVLMDKKKKKSRGMAYVTIAPTGYYQGKRNTRKTLLDWMLGPDAGHTVAGYELEVTLADAKPVEDPERAHEERVEERRRLRLEQEKRRAEAGGMAAATAPAGPEKLLLSPWAKRWRKEIKERLPKESAGPTPWIDPRVKKLATELWDEVVEYVQRGGCQEALCALETFRKDESEEEPPAKRAKGAASEGPWAHVPAADLLLAVGEGIVAFTTEGLVAVLQEAEPTPPPAGRAEFVVAPPALTAAPAPGAAAGARPPLAVAQPPPAAAVAAGPAPPQERGGGGAAGAEKLFVGGLPPTATLEVLRRYFGSYGNIVDAVVMFDKETGKPRGFGFVCFDNVASVNAVMRDYSKHCIDGKWIEVKRATPAPQQAPVAAPPGAAAAQAQVPAAAPAAAPAPAAAAAVAPLPTVPFRGFLAPVPVGGTRGPGALRPPAAAVQTAPAAAEAEPADERGDADRRRSFTEAAEERSAAGALAALDAELATAAPRRAEEGAPASDALAALDAELAAAAPRQEEDAYDPLAA